MTTTLGNCVTVDTSLPAYGITATLKRLRVDRQLEEALTRGADPLHLALVFGIDEKAAIRYADSARRLLESSSESLNGVKASKGNQS
ncbi:hypothetical protein ACWEQ7_21510 [Streptomyces sp. NPDC004069]